MKISELLKQTLHKPFELPSGKWKYYQEWNNTLFLHWEIPENILSKIVPKGLILDSFEGKTYVSLVAFTMQKIRPRNLPALSFISDFYEINLRTYIDNDGRKGVYFLSMEAQKMLSSLISKAVSGLPYYKSEINLSETGFISSNLKRNSSLHAEFLIRDKIKTKTDLDKWLTERYYLYFDRKDRLYRYEVHHLEWELKNVAIRKLEVKYKIGDFDLSDKKPDLVHYSEGVKVLAWHKIKV